VFKNVKLLLEIPTFAVNYEDQLDIRHLSADNAPSIPCDYGECPFVNWVWHYHCEGAGIHCYKWHYIEKKELLPCPLLGSNTGTCNDKRFLGVYRYTHQKWYSWWDLPQLPSIGLVIQCIQSMWHTQYSWKVSRNSELHQIESHWIWLQDVQTARNRTAGIPQDWANFMRCNGNASQSSEFRDWIFIQYNQHSLINHDVSVVGWSAENGTKCWVMRDPWGHPWGEQNWVKLPTSTWKGGKGDFYNIGIEKDYSWGVPILPWFDFNHHQARLEL